MDQLPSELIQSIITQLDDTRDLISLCLVSESLYHETVPILQEYKPLHVIFPDEWKLNKVPVDILAELQGQQLSRLSRARCIQLRAPGFKNKSKRCYHHTAGQFEPLNSERAELDLEHLSEDDKRDWPSRQLTKGLLPTLQLIQENQLVDFSWELGCCIPREIMGSEGWLGRCQSHIQRLKVITAGGCDFSLSGPGDRFNVSLTSFRKLTTLTWTGLLERAVADQVALALAQNASHLECLELDFVCLNPQYKDDRATRFTASRFLRLPDYIYWRPRFPALQKLSLSNVDLGDPEDLVSTFDWTTITHLCLRGCSGARNFLNALAYSDITLHLRKFEISVNSGDANPSEATTMIRFLESFNGLEDLYMHMEADLMGCGDSIWCAVVNGHKSTLRRFVYQAICWQDNGIYESPMPISCLGIDDDGSLDNLSRHNPLSSLNNLECLGLTARPDLLRRIISAFVGHNLRVLHIRTPGYGNISSSGAGEVALLRVTALSNASGASVSDVPKNEVWELLDWLFSEEGITSLDMVVFGDFTNFGRYQDGAFVIKRGKVPARWELYEFNDDLGDHGPKDAAIERLVKKHSEFLESTPTARLIWLN